ncbi:hypothetical protein ACGFX8_32490 [Streptomyces sp. NPDC048362]|uniref:hypothetical protein n=1 Tax=Streptomyces sp. NPDC048362 TaxID=3365539 RepID=UPI003710EF11
MAALLPLIANSPDTLAPFVLRDALLTAAGRDPVQADEPAWEPAWWGVRVEDR